MTAGPQSGIDELYDFINFLELLPCSQLETEVRDSEPASADRVPFRNLRRAPRVPQRLLAFLSLDVQDVAIYWLTYDTSVRTAYELYAVLRFATSCSAMECGNGAVSTGMP